jgi:hypothetical protein
MKISSLQYVPTDHKSKFDVVVTGMLDILKRTGHVMHQEV